MKFSGICWRHILETKFVCKCKEICRFRRPKFQKKTIKERRMPTLLYPRSKIGPGSKGHWGNS
jgi:hypothetical protein